MTMTAPPREPHHLLCSFWNSDASTCDQCARLRVIENEISHVPPAAPSAEPPAQAATERMGTHWETCATDGGPRHYDCALRLIEQQAREIAELHADKDAYHYERAARAEAERDALRECVRAADAMRKYVDLFEPGVREYDTARAKVRP